MIWVVRSRGPRLRNGGPGPLAPP